MRSTESCQTAYIAIHGRYVPTVNIEKKQSMQYRVRRKRKSCFRKKTALRINFSLALGDMESYRTVRELLRHRFFFHQMARDGIRVLKNFDYSSVFCTSSVIEYLILKYVLHSFSVLLDRYLMSGTKVPAKN